VSCIVRNFEMLSWQLQPHRGGANLFCVALEKEKVKHPNVEFDFFSHHSTFFLVSDLPRNICMNSKIFFPPKIGQCQGSGDRHCKQPTGAHSLTRNQWTHG